jgi:hypothetical protein
MVLSKLPGSICIAQRLRPKIREINVDALSILWAPLFNKIGAKKLKGLR